MFIEFLFVFWNECRKILWSIQPVNKCFTCRPRSFRLSFPLCHRSIFSISEIKQRSDVNSILCQLFPKQKIKNEKSLRTLHLVKALFEAHVPSWWMSVGLLACWMATCCFQFYCTLFIMLCQHLCFSTIPLLVPFVATNTHNNHSSRIWIDKATQDLWF